MPAKAKAEAELTRAVRRHRQISTSQAKFKSSLPRPIAHFKGRFGSEGRNIVGRPPAYGFFLP
jgi:hypothetical protein